MSSNQIAIVTGAASGIGLAIAQKLIAAKITTIGWDLNVPEKDLGFPIIKCDVSQESSVIEAYRQVKDKWGSADILVNNCGLQFMSPIEEFPIEKWNQLIGVLLTGTFLCSKVVFKDMKEKKYGRIINISSVHGKLASPFKSAYVAAKHGVHGLSKVMAIEGGEFGITVNNICPGFVDTPLMRNQVKSQMELNNLSEDEVLKNVFLKAQHIKKLTSPEQVADLTYFLCSPSASTITSESFSISGGWGG
ncbi:3-hydroxybutyrate dehydrogenase [Pseudobdellovibrio sp. HCB154]|uniref:3-hydroxybutyrate dehydrogenase n=1 Tax=Pseudobdellovibrio sp. HCB154 TaxID=3386277 RepID=UPI003916D35A